MTQQLEAQGSGDTLLEKTNSDLSKINSEDVKFNCDKILQNVPEPEDEENNTEKEKDKAIKEFVEKNVKVEDKTLVNPSVTGEMIGGKTITVDFGGENLEIFISNEPNHYFDPNNENKYFYSQDEIINIFNKVKDGCGISGVDTNDITKKILGLNQYYWLTKGNRLYCNGLDTQIKYDLVRGPYNFGHLLLKSNAIKDLQQTEMKTEDITTDQQHIVEAKKIIDEGGDTTKIKALNGELAEQLIANYQGEILDLSGLQSIDSETSSFISEFKGKSINLSGLTSLDNESAFRLGDFQGEELNLSGVTNLNERQARGLSNFQGQIIRLGELANLKKIVEERLSAFGGIIYSNGIELALSSTKI